MLRGRVPGEVQTPACEEKENKSTHCSLAHSKHPHLALLYNLYGTMQDMIVAMHISSIFFHEKPIFIKKRLQNCEGVDPFSINQRRGSFHLYLDSRTTSTIFFYISTKNQNENAISSIQFHNAETKKRFSF